MLLHESHRILSGVIMFLIVHHACRHLSMYASQIRVYERSPYVFVCLCACICIYCVCIPVRNMPVLVSCRPGCIDWSRKCWSGRAARSTIRPDPLKLKTCTEDRPTFTTLYLLQHPSLSLLLYCIALQCTFEQCCFNLISKLHYTKLNWTGIEQDWINMNKTELYQTTLKKMNSTIPKQNWIHPNLNELNLIIWIK